MSSEELFLSPVVISEDLARLCQTQFPLTSSTHVCVCEEHSGLSREKACIVGGCGQTLRVFGDRKAFESAR